MRWQRSPALFLLSQPLFNGVAPITQMSADPRSGGADPPVVPAIQRRYWNAEVLGKVLSSEHLASVVSHARMLTALEHADQPRRRNKQLALDGAWLSAFERRELLREQTGEPPWWLEGDDPDLPILKCEGRLDRQPDWAFRAGFGLHGSDVRLLTLTLFPATMSPPTKGLTPDVVRAIRFESLRAEARKWVNLFPEGDSDDDIAGGMGRPGSRGRSDYFYAEWALRYTRALKAGPGPLERLTRDQNVSRSTIRGYIHEARRRGLLTDARQGKAGGKITVKGLQAVARGRQAKEGD